jgi:hypothetical protein
VLSGLAQLNLEVCSVCDKPHACRFCGHQDPDINPITYGHMDFALVESIRSQLDPGVVISFHRDGDPCAYPRLREALECFSEFTTSVVTHGVSLARRAEALISRCSTLTVSVFRGDPDRDLQLDSLRAFLQEKGARAPQVQIKIVGDLSEEEVKPYEELGVRIIRRLIHIPIGNSKYAHRQPTIPEVGICLDALHRPTIDWRGDMFLCNRLDPKRDLYLGSVTQCSLDELWNSERRLSMLAAHQRGRRDLANPLCATCLHWGTPSA